MARSNRKIAGLTVEISGNPTKLIEALKKPEQQANALRDELKEINKALKFDPKNVELLTQKSEVLGKEVAATAEKLQIMRDAQEQVSQQAERGDIHVDQYRAFQRELIQTENSLQDLQNRLIDTDKELSALSGDTKSAAASADVFEQAVRDEIKASEAATDANKEHSESVAGLKDDYKNAKNGAQEFIDTLIKKFAPAALAAAAISKITSAIKSFISEGIKAAQEFKEQYTTLEQVMHNTMDATDEEIQSIIDLAEAQQKIGVVSKSAQISGLAELATFVQRKESLKAMLPVMNDYIAYMYKGNATEENARNIATALGKAILGNIEGLAKQGFTLTETEKKWFKTANEAERVAFVMDMVGESMDGVNESLGKTDVGKLAHANTTINDMKQSVGELASDVKTEFMVTIAPTLERVSLEMKAFFEDNREEIKETVKQLAELTSFLINAYELQTKIIKYTNPMNWGKAIGESIGGLFEPAKEFNEVLHEERENAEKLKTSIAEAWQTKPIKESTNAIDEQTDVIDEQTDAIKERNKAELEAQKEADRIIKERIKAEQEAQKKSSEASQKRIKDLQNEQKEIEKTSEALIKAWQNEQKAAETANNKVIDNLRARQAAVVESYAKQEAAVKSRYDAEIERLNALKKPSGDDAYADYLKSVRELNIELNKQNVLAGSRDKQTSEAAKKRIEEIRKTRNELNKAEQNRQYDALINKQIVQAEAKRDAELKGIEKTAAAEKERYEKRIEQLEKELEIEKERIQKLIDGEQKIQDARNKSAEDQIAKIQKSDEIAKAASDAKIAQMQAEAEASKNATNSMVKDLNTYNDGVKRTTQQSKQLFSEMFQKVTQEGEQAAKRIRDAFTGLNVNSPAATAIYSQAPPSSHTGSLVTADGLVNLQAGEIVVRRDISESLIHAAESMEQTRQMFGQLENIITNTKTESPAGNSYNSYNIEVNGLVELQKLLEFQDNLRRRERAAGKR